MDDMELIRGLGRDLEHEPRPTLARQRERLLRQAGDRPRRRWPGRWPMLGVVAAVTAAAVLAPALLTRGGAGEEAGPAAGHSAAPATSGFNMLMIGSDTRDQASAHSNTPRSDTLMLLHVPDGRGSARVVSFPRDLLVDIPQCEGRDGAAVKADRGLINAPFTRGGAACTRKTVERLTGVGIDRTVVLGFEGVAEIVDALGGVEVELPRAVDDEKSGLALPAGRHRLDGKQALAYVRARYGLGDGSDLDRIERQQRFLTSMAKEVAGLRKDPAALTRFFEAAAEAVETTPRLDAQGLAELARSLAKVDSDDIGLETVPVVPAPADPDRLVLDRKPAQELFSQLR